jgi:hypothetical protein
MFESCRKTIHVPVLQIHGATIHVFFARNATGVKTKSDRRQNRRFSSRRSPQHSFQSASWKIIKSGLQAMAGRCSTLASLPVPATAGLRPSFLIYLEVGNLGLPRRHVEVEEPVLVRFGRRYYTVSCEALGRLPIRAGHGHAETTMALDWAGLRSTIDRR